MMKFTDRKHAGQLLAKKLSAYIDQPNVIVLALPRGGVPVAAEIAQYLHAPLDIFLVRKLGAPGNKEYAIGAITLDNIVVLNDAALNTLQIPEQELDEIIIQEEKELWRRNQLYRQGKAAPTITKKTVIIVDDGLATGSTMRAAITGIKRLLPAKIIVAIPVAAPTACDIVKEEADELICLQTPEYLNSVGYWYEDFAQTTDQEVLKLLNA